MEYTSESKSGFSRRQFIAALGVSALGVAGSGLVGCAPQSSEAAGDAPATKKGPSEPGPDETLQADVCIVGAGPTGLTAAVQAAEDGASVVVIDQDDIVGICGHSITAVGTSWQKEQGYDMSPEELVEFWTVYPSPQHDREMMLFAAQHSAESIEWLADHGVDFVGATVPPTNPFQYPPRTLVTSAGRDGGTAYMQPLKAVADDLGVEFHYETIARGLIKDDGGAIVGVEAEGTDGHKVTVNAASVILTTGGYGSDDVLIRQYAPRTPNVGPLVGGSNGFAIKQAMQVGAEIVMPGGTQAFFGNADGANPDNAGQGIAVAPNGKRFVNEHLYVLDRSAIAFDEGISMYYQIYDTPLLDTLFSAVSINSGDSFYAGTKETNGNLDGLEKGIENGTVFRADTIEELASQLGINAATLKETVDTYNGYCSQGEDADFGKPAKAMGLVSDPAKEHDYDPDTVEQEFTLLNPIQEAPFYAVMMTADSSALTGTQGGIKIDADARVIGVDGEPVTNLFAAGEAANGQLIGYHYPQSGTSLCMCFCFGRYAGANAAANAQ